MSQDLEIASNEEIKRCMMQCIDRLLAQEIFLNPLGRASKLCQLLANACKAVELGLHFDNAISLISLLNLDWHLRYPSNHFLGELLRILPTREEGLSNLRKFGYGETKQRHLPEHMNLFLRSTAIHMLAHHGDHRHRENIKNLIQDDFLKQSTFDRLIGAGGLLGLILVSRDIQITEQYLSALKSNENLANPMCK